MLFTVLLSSSVASKLHVGLDQSPQLSQAIDQSNEINSHCVFVAHVSLSCTAKHIANLCPSIFSNVFVTELYEYKKAVYSEYADVFNKHKINYIYL